MSLMPGNAKDGNFLMPRQDGVMSCLRRKETRKIVTRLTSPAVRADKGALPVIPEPDPVFDRCGNRSPVISWGFMIRLPILATAFRQLRAKRWHLRLFALPQRDSHGLRMSRLSSQPSSSFAKDFSTARAFRSALFCALCALALG